MSISEIQRRRVFEEITRAMHASGERPRLIDIMTHVSKYFSKFPAGVPLPLPIDSIQDGITSNVDEFNRILAHMATNLDVIYEATNQQVDDIMTLTSSMNSGLERLKARREALIHKIDDYLFSLYNTDGYYYSFSDTFSNLDFTDLQLTSAYVDLAAGTVALPTVSGLTTQITPDDVISMNVVVSKASDTLDQRTNEPVMENISHKTLAPFSGAIDGLTNTMWAIEVETTKPEEVVCRVELRLKSIKTVSRVEFDPWGAVPVQLWIDTGSTNPNSSSSVEQFGNQIQTSPYKMSFVDNAVETDRIILNLRKTEPDYTLPKSGTNVYRYIFAAKNIVISEHVYDSSATWVSKAIGMPDDLVGDAVIDAVSMVTVETLPPNTEIKYFVASDLDDDAPDLSDFDWKEIEPIDSLNPSEMNIARFLGAQKNIRNIRRDVSVDSRDLLLIALDDNLASLDGNPSAAVLTGVDVYRLAEFSDAFLSGSISLEEGVNTTRIMYTDTTAAVGSAPLELDFWTDYVSGASTPTDTLYGRIDTSADFFSGDDIGEGGQSVYVETYLESLSDRPTLLKKLSKVQLRTSAWEVKVFLNGQEIAYLPSGTNDIVVPWKFQQGLNHIAMTIMIPDSSVQSEPHLGSIDLMGDNDLFDYGTVKLATWGYVDPFHMQFNEVDQPKTFTVYNGEIISRRKPTDNFLLRYAKSTDAAPDAIRVRADLLRTIDDQYVTPIIDMYRLRFLYS